MVPPFTILKTLRFFWSKVGKENYHQITKTELFHAAFSRLLNSHSCSQPVIIVVISAHSGGCGRGGVFFVEGGGKVWWRELVPPVQGEGRGGRG